MIVARVPVVYILGAFLSPLPLPLLIPPFLYNIYHSLRHPHNRLRLHLLRPHPLHDHLHDLLGLRLPLRHLLRLRCGLCLRRRHHLRRARRQARGAESRGRAVPDDDAGEYIFYLTNIFIT